MGGHTHPRADGRDTADRIASWALSLHCHDHPADSVARARLLLLDTYACALAARTHPVVAQIERTCEPFGLGFGATVIGTERKLPVMSAVLVNGTAIRALDWNDIYWGPRSGGHPSDIAAVALAIAEVESANCSDLMDALIVGYELYCRISDLLDPSGPVDHTSAGTLASALVAAKLLRLDSERTAQALRLAATNAITASIWRVGSIATGKAAIAAWANQAGGMAALMAANGITGPRNAIDATKGFAGFLAKEATLEHLVPEQGETHRKLDEVATKHFPCVGTAQPAIAAAIDIHAQLRSAGEKPEMVILHLRDIPAIRNQSSEAYRRPKSTETADHSPYFTVAAGLLDGALTPHSLSSERWRNADILALIDAMTISLDMPSSESGSFPARLEVRTTGGRVLTAEQHASPGGPGSPDAQPRLREKLRHAMPEAAPGALDRLADFVATMGNRDKVSSLMHLAGSVQNSAKGSAAAPAAPTKDR